MAEVLRKLVVALSLDSSNFSRNMRTINQQIKETESTFRLTGLVSLVIWLQFKRQFANAIVYGTTMRHFSG